MHVAFDPEGTIEGLKKCLFQAARQADDAALLVLSAAGNSFTPDTLSPVLQNTSATLMGGIFPGIIFGNQMFEKGNLVIRLPNLVRFKAIEGLSDNRTDFESILEPQPEDINKNQTLLIFVDGFATRITAFIETLFSIYGFDLNYIGGGAGSLSLEQGAYVFTNKGLLEDGAVLAFLDTASAIGVSHGWQELAGPFQVTESTKNTIHSIEWQPAFDFYSDVLEEHAGMRVSKDHFYTAAQNHPFGIARLDGEHIVRDPYEVGHNGSLSCFGEIPEGTFVSILQAQKKDLIDAAGDTLLQCLQTFPEDKTPGQYFFVDCISRTIVLGKDFQKEIDAIHTPNVPLVGVCSIGEIANSGTEYLEWYNKTSVMAVLE